MRLSASSIKDSKECNLKGFWKYVEKKEVREHLEKCTEHSLGTNITYYLPRLD